MTFFTQLSHECLTHETQCNNKIFIGVCIYIYIYIYTLCFDESTNFKICDFIIELTAQ